MQSLILVCNVFLLNEEHYYLNSIFLRFFSSHLHLVPGWAIFSGLLTCKLVMVVLLNGVSGKDPAQFASSTL